jgi:hypothetical protein
MNKTPRRLKRREFFSIGTQTAVVAFAATGYLNLPAAEPDAAEKSPSPPIQIGILLGTYRSGSLETRLDAAKSAGINYVQLSMDCAGLPTMPDEISPEVVGQSGAPPPPEESRSRQCRALLTCATPTPNSAN